MHWSTCLHFLAHAEKRAREKEAARAEAEEWLNQHRSGIIAALDVCGDLDRLREAAKRLGYDENVL